MSAIPLACVNSQSDPPSVLRSRAEKRTRILVVASTGSTPPSGTTIVWPVTVAGTATPSTVTGRRRMLPRRAAIVLSSTRSIAIPDVFLMIAVESTHIARVDQVSFRLDR